MAKPRAEKPKQMTDEEFEKIFFGPDGIVEKAAAEFVERIIDEKNIDWRGMFISETLH